MTIICNYNKSVADFKSLNNKNDLIWLITKNKGYKAKDLKKYTKQQLFMMWCKIDFKIKNTEE